jgi:Spy/CpxP family protein refolding chaperone
LTAVALAAGCLIGFAASTVAYRYRILQVPGARLIDRMDRDLNLTPAERRQVAEILHTTRFNTRRLREELHQRREDLFFQAYKQIRAVLAPEQQKRFDDDFAPPEFVKRREQESGR